MRHGGLWRGLTSTTTAVNDDVDTAYEEAEETE